MIHSVCLLVLVRFENSCLQLFSWEWWDWTKTVKLWAVKPKMQSQVIISLYESVAFTSHKIVWPIVNIKILITATLSNSTFSGAFSWILWSSLEVLWLFSHTLTRHIAVSGQQYVCLKQGLSLAAASVNGLYVSLLTCVSTVFFSCAFWCRVHVAISHDRSDRWVPSSCGPCAL